MRVNLTPWCVASSLVAVGVGVANGQSPLVDAVKRDDSVAVRALLQRVDVNTSDADSATALHWAVYRDDLDTADALIRAGAKVEAANRYGVTPLSLACVNGNARMIEMLLKAGADVNAELPEGETALMTASRTENLAAVQVLLAHGADANARERWRGQTAVMWAAAEGQAEVVQALVERGADIHARSNAGFTALLFAARQGQIEAVSALLKAGADVNETLPSESPGENVPPVGAARQPYGRLDGASALMLAVRSGHFELAALLLDKGADPNAHGPGWTALHEITWVRRPGFGHNFPGPVGSGAMDNLEFVRKLAAHGADLNARMTARPGIDPKTVLKRIGATPFLLAARAADPLLMRLLGELGADPLIPNEDGTTPLMAAAGVGVYSPGEDAGTEPETLEATKVAWELGGDVNAVDKHGETAMHGAAYMGANSVAEFLVEKGAKIEIWNQKNDRGWTPLEVADGVFRTGNFRAAPHTAALLRQLLSDPAAANQEQPR